MMMPRSPGQIGATRVAGVPPVWRGAGTLPPGVPIRPIRNPRRPPALRGKPSEPTPPARPLRWSKSFRAGATVEFPIVRPGEEGAIMYQVSVYAITVGLWRWEVRWGGALLRCGTAPTQATAEGDVNEVVNT